MFLDRGFDRVSVAEIAAESQVSKMTIFNYFPTKEDIVLGQLRFDVHEPARVVRQRPDATSPLTALAEHFVAGVRAHDPATGLSSEAGFVALRHLVEGTRSLVIRQLERSAQSEAALAVALGEVPGAGPVTSRVVAGQLVATQRALAAENFQRVVAGTDPSELTERAVGDARTAFGWISTGLAGTVFGP